MAMLLTACRRSENPGMPVKSTAFDDGERIPERYSCFGQGVSPPLQWSGVPFKTEEQAIVVHDPDAPSGTFYHWVLVGIPGETRSLAEGEVPAGAVQGVASSGLPSYIGMCPPKGKPHRYVFTVYALDDKLGLGENVTAADAFAAIDQHTAAKGELTGTYEAPNA
jgi:Raf kinase inhibitor-like YbhB/YbcL family protein